MTQKTDAPTILIVDDTPSNLGMVVNLLEGRGYRVAIAQDGEEGLQRAQILQPALILLDVMMPGADGFEICQCLKALESTRDIPVIFMTALASLEHKVKGFTAGGVDYITKPLQIEEVISRVDTHIKLHSARRQLEIQNLQLQARQQEYRTLIDALPDMVVRYDNELRRTYVNPAWEKASGLSAEAVINIPGPSILPQSSSNQYIVKLRKVLETGTVQNIEFDWVNARGEAIYLDYTIVPEFDQHGKVIGALSVGHDITERKRMEVELHGRERESRRLAQFQHSLLSGMLDAGVILVVIENGNFVYTNDRYVGCQLGYAEGQLPESVSFINLIHPDDRPRIAEMHRDRLAGKTVPTSYEIGVLAGDGSRLEYEFHVTVVPDTEPPQTLLLALDISKRKHDERELRILAHAINSASDSIFLINGQQRFVYVNDSACRSLGYSRADLEKMGPADINPDMTRKMIVQMQSKMFVNGPQLGRIETQHRAADGHNFPVELNASLIEINGDKKTLVVVRDITERKQAEQQVRDLSAHLLTVREEEKTHLAREIHDDLGSTLAAIKLKISLLLDFELPDDMKDTPSHARLESILPMLDSAVSSMRRIITGMRPEVLDNLGLLAALRWQAEQFQTGSGIECLIVCGNDHGCVDCKGCEFHLDKTLSINLFRIFQEALTNVARHSGATRVEVKYQPGNGAVLLSIYDNGCGLPDGFTPASGSFGIRGMRERVSQLGGQITFDSPPGGGFGVTVIFPLVTIN